MISVVIPVLNEAGMLGPLLESLAHQDVACEVIVVDGGSRDDTVAVARRSGATVIGVPRGRAVQLAAGADRARGDVLLFLHADSRLAAGSLAAVAHKLVGAPDLSGGNFRLVFDGDDRFSRWLTGFYRWLRSNGFYYGDSGIFVRRAVYERLGGFRPIALMEDYDFVRKLERLGPTCCIDEPPLVTSSRRFHGRRPVAIVGYWLWIHARYHLGLITPRLAAAYDRKSLPAGIRGVGL